MISEADLPVERYYHWCFCDNFEWIEGESARFGLVHVDYETQKRTVKKSGAFFAAMIKAGGVTPELYEEYVKNKHIKLTNLRSKKEVRSLISVKDRVFRLDTVDTTYLFPGY